MRMTPMSRRHPATASAAVVAASASAYFAGSCHDEHDDQVIEKTTSANVSHGNPPLGER